LKRNAPFLVYLYYAFDNRPAWFKALWKASDGVRRVVSGLPWRQRIAVTDAIAACVYWPLARAARIAERARASVEQIPLSFYRGATFYTMRTNALDRFGTRLEQRFTAEQIRQIMTGANLVDVRLNDSPPYWCAVGARS